MAKGDDLTNPITKLQPNQFTQVTNRELPKPVNAQLPPKSPDAGRLRKLHTAGLEDVNQAPVGYRRPEGMSHENFTWLTGGHHMFPNMQAQAGTPAINEPHAAEPGVTAQRRAEDLSKPEYDKGVRILQNYGYGKDPVKELTDLHANALDRLMGEHVAAGVNESSSQHFYGGAPTTTHIPDPTLQKVHDTGVGEAHGRFEEGVQHLTHHEHFQTGTQGLPSDVKEQGARNIMAQSTADTSPNSKWRTTKGWPNMEQAEESASAGMEDRKSRFVTGRVQNHEKAAKRTVEMLETAHTDTPFAAHHYGDPTGAPKTIAFRGALVNPNSTDAYKVSDVHEGGVMLPGAPTAKALANRDSAGTRHWQHPDQPPSRFRGMTPEADETGKQVTGNARAEDMLGQSKGIVHALNDHASRKALADAGLSRSVNHSDNIHAYQGAAWGSQQVHRPDLTVSHADQYPVVRNWAAEGHTPPLTEAGKSMFPTTPQQMRPQFARNPNNRRGAAGGTNPAKDTHRSQAYPIEP